jgi:hypothetical protein
MDAVETISVLAGSVILLGVFLSIAYETVIIKRSPKKNIVSVLDNKWQKLKVSIR